MKHCCNLILSLLMFFLCACGEQAQAKKAAKNSGVMNITSAPDGAEITIMGKNIGITPRKTNPVPPAMYIVKISKEGYDPQWIPVEVTPGKEVGVHAVLRQWTSVARITSKPSGAEVSRDGVKIGVTPCLITGLQRGPQSIRLTMPDCFPREFSWEVTSDRPFAGHVELESNTGVLDMRSVPEGANVFLNDKPRGVTPLQETLAQGEYSIRVEKHGYEPYSSTVSIKRNESTEMNATLQIKPMELRVKTTPCPANLFINGKNYGMTPYVLRTTIPGKYSVRVSKDNFAGSAKDIVLEPGATVDIELTLDSEFGAAEFIAWPGIVEIYCDGKPLGRTVQDPNNPNCSKIFRIPDLIPGKHKLEVIHKRAKPSQRITVPFNVSKKKTTRLKDVHLWVPNVKLNLKNGIRIEGRVLDQKSDPLVFEYKPGIKIEYPKEQIKKIETIVDYE